MRPCPFFFGGKRRLPKGTSDPFRVTLYSLEAMQRVVFTAVFSAMILCGQSPDFTGVWKADLSQSKLSGPPGPPPSKYLVLIEQKPAEFNRRTHEQAPLISETTGVWGERGQQRTLLTVFNNGQPRVRAYQGVPTRMTASMHGSTLTITGEVAGRSSGFTRTYKVSPDGKTLNVSIVSTNEGKTMESTLLLVKQADADGEELRKPEETAEAHFKNVKTASLKKLPESEFINQMHYFAWSLNRNCEFCHVAHKFDSDDKDEKKTARKMIDMVAAIDENHFDGHPDVRCFTCHEGHARPLAHPQYPDEAAEEKAGIEKAAAERRQAAPPQGAPPVGPR